MAQSYKQHLLETFISEYYASVEAALTDAERLQKKSHLLIKCSLLAKVIEEK